MKYIYHYIYKTTCIITNKFYIGMHSTNNLDDGYQGSGKILKYSINKYGKENHKTEIIEKLPNREDLIKKEKELVNRDLLNEDLCMNLVTGGDGGYNEEAIKANKLKRGKKWKDILKSKETLDKMKYTAKKNYKNSIKKYNFKYLNKEKRIEIAKLGNRARTESGYKHSKKTIEKIRKRNQGKTYSKDYKDLISRKTKEAMANMDKDKFNDFQKRALESRKLFYYNKHKKQYNQIIKLKEIGLGISEIAKEMNISGPTCYSIIKKFND